MKNHTITKQLICLALAILTVISFSSCNNTPEVTENSESVSETMEIKKWDEFRVDDYTIKKDGDRWAFVFDDPSLYTSGLGNIAQIKYESMDQWVNKVMKGNLTSGEKGHIRFAFACNSCDFNNLYTPKLPNDLNLAIGVTWIGDEYRFDFGNSSLRGSVTFSTKIDYDREYHSEYSSYLSREDLEESPDRNSKILYTTVNGEKDKKYVFYSFENDARKIYIVEKYYLKEEFNGYIQPSSTIPYDIKMFYTYDNCYCQYYLTNLTERPSVEYLLQFGEEHYVNTAYEGE